MDREVKLNSWQILASPFVSLKNMVTSKSDIDPEIELNIDSSDKVEAELAKSSESIDSKVDAYGNAGKAQRREVLKSVKVDKKDLQPQEKGKVTQKQAEKQIGEDGSR